MSFEGLERLLVGSVPTACANLTNHLNQCFESDVHAKSFYEFLPKLCQILYGSKESRGWLHLPMSKAEEDPLFELIRPRGVLMRFLLSRYLDAAFIYEMVPDSLPRRTQTKLDPTQYLNLPPIYLTRVNLVKTAAPVGAQKTMTTITKVNINFNMLEYFLFYFAYALTLDDDDVNFRGMRRTDPKVAFKIHGPPANATSAPGARPTGWAAGNPPPKAPTSRVLVDGSFFNLYQQYLHYFLPIPERALDSPAEAKESQAKKRPLDVFNDTTIENSADKQQTHLGISEFFIGTIVELWLGQNDKGVDNRVVRYVQPGADIAECVSILLSHLAGHDCSQYVLGGELLPTHVQDSTGKMVLNVAGMARKSAYQYIRPQLYTFLQLGLQFWPLDDTFPSLVDTWMTWITPWRYGRRDASVTGDTVSEKWQPFVFDNLLFYTALLEHYMPRLSNPPQTSRVAIVPAPLSLNKELRSIQKVMKVYRAGNLKEILKIAEQAIVWPENFSTSSYAMFEALAEGGLAGSGRQDPTSTFLAGMVNVLHRQLQQLEGSQYNYEALFLVEGSGRSKIRMILTKLGNAVDLRQERLQVLEAKNKPSDEPVSGWGMVSSKLNELMNPAPPKTVSQDPAIYKRELKALRDTMMLIGDVFDLFPEAVKSFEKQQQTGPDRVSTLTAEQLEALIPPLEEPETLGLLGPEQQRKYVPRGLVRKPIDDIQGRGRRAEELVLSYESEFLVSLTRRAENHLTPKWQRAVRKVNGLIPLPEQVKASRVHLRWMASIPNVTCFAVLLLAIVSFYLLSAYLGSLGQTGRTTATRHQHRLKEPFVNTPVADSDRGGILGQYDAHVQPLVRWEKPGQRSGSSHVVNNRNQNANRNQNNNHNHNNYNNQQRQRAPTRTRTPAPEYTIELKEI
ncbi:sphingomyelin phosphodiesterase 4, neutral membrane (neutral sphingomyelinase-3) [Mortierella sp. AD032]|nr:sphingomyelin phosphodiesterase 4, neutral membrane (neutral sphingomyelinase-3) [Mortierella sp. AD032]